MILDEPGTFSLTDVNGGEWVCRELPGALGDQHGDQVQRLATFIAKETALGRHGGKSRMKGLYAADREDLRRQLVNDVLSRYPSLAEGDLPSAL
jgi:hypothetical protein